MSDPQEIYIQPECCADPNVGRLWSEHDPCEDWSDPDCDEESTRYIRADLVNERIAQLEKIESLLREMFEAERSAGIAFYSDSAWEVAYEQLEEMVMSDE